MTDKVRNNQEMLAVELQHKINELTMLQRVDQELNATVFNFENAMTLTLDWAMRRTGAAIGLLVLVTTDGAGLIPLLHPGVPAEHIQAFSADNPIPINWGVIGRAVRLKQMQVVPDTHDDPDYVDIMNGTMNAQIAVPMIMRGEVLGVISLESEQNDGFDNMDLSFLTRLASRAAVALDNSRLYEATERRADEMASLYHAGRTISSTLEREGILTSTAQAFASLLNGGGTIMTAYNANRGYFEVEKVYRLGTARHSPALLPAIKEILNPADFPEFARTVESQQPFQLRISESASPAILQWMADHRYRTILFVPVTVQTQLLGAAILVDGRRERVFGADDILLAESLTSQAAAALRLSTLFQEVRELENIKSEMIRMASHDLRTPLGSALNYLELLMMDLESTLGAKHHDYVSVIRRSMMSMKNLIDELLNVEKLESERQSAWVSFDFGQLVRDIMDPQQADAQAKKQTLTWAITEEDLPLNVLGSLTQLKQAVTNLVNNAIKYTPDGGKIEVRLFRAKNGLQFEVQDNGLGIPKNRQDRLFQRFYRARQRGTDNIPGTGLGLSLVKTVVERHSGEIWVHSDEGVGSTFGFWLPNPPTV